MVFPYTPSAVMPGLEPGIQGLLAPSLLPWIAGSSPAMTSKGTPWRA
jgi:hypothetical protein